MKKPGPTYAAPIDREHLPSGVFLVSLRGVSAKDNARNRQRAFDFIMERFEQGLAPFDASDCFESGLSEDDLIFIPPSPEPTMSKARTSKTAPKAAPDAAKTSDTTKNSGDVAAKGQSQTQTQAEHQSQKDDIVLAASEILDLAKLKVSLAHAYRDARQYKNLVFKVVDADGGPLSDEECEIIADKSFAKSIKGLADAKVKVSMWYENASGNHELILNELAFMDEEMAAALETANGNGNASKTQDKVEAG